MSSNVLYKCSFCLKFTESDTQHFMLLGKEQVGGRMVSNEIALCPACDKVFRKLLKVVSDAKVFEVIQTESVNSLTTLLLSGEPRFRDPCPPSRLETQPS